MAQWETGTDVAKYPAWRGWRLYMAVLALAGTLFVLTTQHGPAWQDSGTFQVRCVDFDLRGDMGVALAHPLLIVLGHAATWLPWGDLAWRINLVSALFGAIAVANVALLTRRLVPQYPLAAWLAGGFLAVSHTTWWLATIAESQAVNLAFFTTSLHVLVSLGRRPGGMPALLLGLTAGLGTMAHNLSLLATPVYLVVVIYLCLRRGLRWWAVGLLALGWVLGAGGLLAMTVEEATRIGIGGAISSMLFGYGYRGSVLNLSPNIILRGLGYVAFNFPSLALPLALVGFIKFRKSLGGAIGGSLVAITSIYFVFAVRYLVPDQFMFFLPFYALVAVWAGVGLAILCSPKAADTQNPKRSGRPLLVALTIITLLATPTIYAATPELWRAAKLPPPGRQDLPYRDAYAYWFCPWKCGEQSAWQFARAAIGMEARPPLAGSTIIADSTSVMPLVWVKRFEAPQADMTILRESQAKADEIAVGTPNLFVVSNLKGYHPAWLDEKAQLVKEGVLYRVAWNTPTTAPLATRP